MDTTDTLAGWASSLQYESLPADVVAKAKLCLADSITCLVGGIDARPSRTLSAVLREAGQGAVSVPGTRQKFGLLDAAYYSAQTTNVLDFDDDMIGHPGATVNPIALVVGQFMHSSGKDLLAATVAGYEVSVRIGEAAWPTYERRREVIGFSTWQTFGALVTAGKLMSLSRDGMANAMGLAGAQAPVPNVRVQFKEGGAVGWLKNGYGIAGQAGVLSAHLASEGFEGNRNILDGANGYWIMSGSDRYRPELAVEDLGDVWKIREVNFKSFACCYFLQSMLEAVDAVRQKVDAPDVERIVIAGFDELSRLFCGPMPTSIFEAQFHAPYLASLQWLGRSPAQGLNEGDLSDPAVVALARKIEVLHDPAADMGFREHGLYPVRVIVFGKTATPVEAYADTPRAAQPGARIEELVERKFFTILPDKLGKRATAQAWQMIHDIESHSTKDLVSMLVPADE